MVILAFCSWCSWSLGLKFETRVYTVGSPASDLGLAIFMLSCHIGYTDFPCPLDNGVAVPLLLLHTSLPRDLVVEAESAVVRHQRLKSRQSL